MVGAQRANSFPVTCWCLDARSGAARMYSQLAKFKSVADAGESGQVRPGMKSRARV
jgi:hypothetical protein